MRPTSFSVMLILLVVGMLGCTQPQTHVAQTSADSWFHPPSERKRFRSAAHLPDADITEVSTDRLAAAEEQLRLVACLEITSDQAAALTGKSFSLSDSNSLFLVRAVYLNYGTGKFTVVPLDRELLVEHGSLGHSAVPMKRQPLVVRLPQKPETVYISCSMLE